jgi:hypothetical protein
MKSDNFFRTVYGIHGINEGEHDLRLENLINSCASHYRLKTPTKYDDVTADRIFYSLIKELRLGEKATYEIREDSYTIRAVYSDFDPLSPFENILLGVICSDREIFVTPAIDHEILREKNFNFPSPPEKFDKKPYYTDDFCADEKVYPYHQDITGLYNRFQ